jgi:hypothetical protein
MPLPDLAEVPTTPPSGMKWPTFSRHMATGVLSRRSRQGCSLIRSPSDGQLMDNYYYTRLTYLYALNKSPELYAKDGWS